MSRTRHSLPLTALLLCGTLFLAASMQAQGVKHWVGGSGEWADAAHWSATADGPGGAGVPRADDEVSVASTGSDISIRLDGRTAIGSLRIMADRGAVDLGGNGDRLRIHGGMVLHGSVHWAFGGDVDLTADAGIAELDLRGIPVAGNMSFTGGGTWSMLSDLVVQDDKALELRAGTLVTNGNMLRAGTLRYIGHQEKRLMTGGSVVVLARAFEPGTAHEATDTSSSRLIVGGAPTSWGQGSTHAAETERGTNICGTGGGQTIFTINAQLQSNYNGFGVTCHGVCNGSVHVSVTGGVGPFTYGWVGGPNTATWNNVCPGNQIVIVTDQGQGISCATTIQVTDPPLLSVIFFGNTSPTCAGVCNGTSNAFAVGGVPVYGYSWNNGAGTGSSYAALCPGANTLHVNDVNNCSFDTTFIFNIQPVQPHFMMANAHCANTCDGTASVAPTGGSGTYTYDWQPGSPAGDGTRAVTGLCPGAYSVTVLDANGCDTTVQFQITAPLPITPHAVHTNAVCWNSCNGTATVAPTGSAGPFGYSWAPVPGGGQNSATATGLCAGIYAVTIVDVTTGCDTVVQITITAPPAIIPHAAHTNATCANSCNGTATVAPTGGSPGYTYQWSPVPPVGQGTAHVDQLCAGAWSVTITDAVGCDTSVQFQITAPPPIHPNGTHTDVNCAGTCDGTANVAATGGSGTLTYTWSPTPPSGQGTPSASQLCAGTWNVTIVDANGCDTTMAFVIVEPQPLIANVALTNASCGNACNGTATATVSGGIPGYAYLWTPAPGTGQGTASAGGLCPGNYSLAITDANGCDTIVPFAISRPTPITVTATLAPVTCGGLCNGEITLATSGGTGTYTWTWTPAPDAGQGTPHVSGLCPGSWSVLVADQGGCDTTLTFNLGAPQPLDPHGTFTNETCTGPCDGTATVAPTGGNGTFTYHWTPEPAFGQGTSSTTGLCAGPCTVTITDAGGCDTTWAFTILPATSIAASLSTVDGLCWSECTGEATVTASGGSGTYTYLWAPPPPVGQGTASASGLCQGPGTVTISDGSGCDTTLVFEIFKSPPIQTNLTVLAENCTGACSGEAGVFPSGGSGSFSYSWQPAPGGGQGTNIATGLCAGTVYSVTITDGNGCDTTQTFQVQPYTPVAPNLSTTPTSCIGACNGSVTAVPTGGEEPYTYFWDPVPANGQGNSTANGLCAGSYSLTITDDNGCDTTVSAVITSPAPIDPHAAIQPIGCGGQCVGAITLAPTGGSGGYGYAWTPAPPAGQGTASASQLCAGDWSVAISDADGCDTIFTFSLIAPLPLMDTADLAASHCNVCDGSIFLHVNGGSAPYSFTWGPPLNTTTSDSVMTGLCAGLYTVTITDASGCSIQRSFAISDSDGEVISVTDGMTSCPNTCDGSVSVAFNCTTVPCTVAWSNLSGTALGQTGDTLNDRCAGGYIVSVTNGAGCVSIDTAHVNAPPAFVGNISSTPPSCALDCNGTATIGLVGGVGPFTITWTPEPGVGQGTPHVTGLCPGPYAIAVQDLGGCDADFNVLITSPPPVTVAPMVADISCTGECDGAISIGAQGGSGAFTYNWSPTPTIGQGTSVASSLCAGDYTVMVADMNGCDTTLSFTLSDPSPLTLDGTTSPGHCSVCDGSATLTISGGSGAASVTWTNSTGITVGTGTSLTGLCAGVYVAHVTDAHGCTLSHTFTVTDTNGESLAVTNGQTLCSNACDGTVSVSYNCSSSPCTVSWFDAGANLLAQGTDSLSGLCTGMYIVQVANGAGCTTIDTALVIPSHSIIPNLSTTKVTCNGICDGTATVGPTGGVAPYTYNWSPEPGGGQGAPHVIGLCAGVYHVAIADASGCDTIINVLITTPAPIAVSAQFNNVSCNGACDGGIILNATGGNGFFTYTWSPVPANGQGSNSATGLCPGDWAVTIADLHGCDTTITYTIIEPPPLSISTTSTLSTCGVCSGTASVHLAGGVAPYFISWTQGGNIIATDSAATGLCAGIYTVTVTDSHGCPAQAQVAIGDMDGEAVSTTDFLLACPDHCDGVVSTSFNCMVPVCSVAWFDQMGTDLGVTTDTLTGRCAGLYLVRVTNGAGCVTVDTASVTAPAPILPHLSTTPTTCASSCDGTATVGPTGGAGGYQYTWTPEPMTGQGTSQATGFCGGTAGVVITDTVGCSITQGVLILSPPSINAVAVVGRITCNGACNGSITVIANGGTGPLSYEWSPEPGAGQGTSTATGLCAGAWGITISDANGCDTTFTLALTDPPVLTVDITHTDNVCFTDCHATAHAAIAGGILPYSITWTDATGTTIAQDTTDVASLCGGSQTFTVTDAHGCQVTVPFTVNTGVAIEANLEFNGETCHGPCDGTASVSPTGGSGSGYIILWQPEPPVGQGTDQVSGLCPGNWSVTISDSIGCDTIHTFTIAPFTPIQANAAVHDVSCNGACNGSISLAATGGTGSYTYQWTPEPGTGQGTAIAGSLCPGDWTVAITDDAGCDTTVTFTVHEPSPLVVTLDTVTAASCNTASDGAVQASGSGGTPGYTYSWVGPNGFTSTDEDLAAVVPGDYVLSVTDQNGCQSSTTATVGALNSVTADAGPDLVICTGVGIVLAGSASQGGFTYQWTDGQGTAVGTGTTVSLGVLPSGTYTYVLRAADGPCADTDTLLITVLSAPIADAGPDQSVLVQGNVVLGGSPSGPPGSSFVWHPDSLLNDHSVANPTASVHSTTLFTLTVTDADGCTNTDSVLVTVIPEIKAPSGFTPNGDGHNDVWVLDFASLFPDIDVRVFSRWGEPLFHSVGYAVPWDGKYNGGVVPMGTYYYVIDLHDPRYPDALTGPLTVIR